MVPTEFRQVREMTHFLEMLVPTLYAAISGLISFLLVRETISCSAE